MRQAAQDSAYRPGERIAGRFLVHEVKKGGMGEVYLCLDEQQNLPFALKTVRREWWASPKARELFEREVGTWVSLGRHANIVRCYHLETFDERPFMLLEWIAGESDRGASLREWLQLRGPPDLRTALQLAIDIVRGLEYAQQQVPGIVHRDLKPENVLVAAGPLAKVSDFGLARVADGAFGDEAPAGLAAESTPGTGAGAPARTWWRRLLGATGNAPAAAPAASEAVAPSVHGTRMHGTQAYMAPEQWLGHRLDARTDIYAFGCLLHELLTGRLPYVGSEAQLQASHLQGSAPLASQLPNVPAEVGRIVERCLQKAPEHRPATLAELRHELEAVYRSQCGEPPRAAPVAEALTAVDYNNRGTTFHSLQRYDEALADFARAIKLAPGNAETYSNRGNTYAQLHRFNEALAEYARAIEANPEFAGAYSNRGHTYHEMERYQEAIADYARAIELRPTLAEVYSNRGLTYRALQRFEEALADHTRAIELNPANAETYNNRGIAYARLQRYDEALRDFARAIELRPLLAEAYNNRASSTYHELKRYDEALADYAHAIELRPDYPEAFNNRGNTYAAMGRYDEALANFTRAIELRQTYAEPYNNRGTVYYTLRRYAEAFADFAQAIKLRPAYSLAHNNRGLTNKALKLYEEALADFGRAITLAPADATPYWNRGLVYHAVRRYDEALTDYTRAIKLHPLGADAFCDRGVTLYALQRYDEAHADYARAIKLQPTHANAHLNIGVMFANLELFDKALPYFDTAARLGQPLGAEFAAMARERLQAK